MLLYVLNDQWLVKMSFFISPEVSYCLDNAINFSEYNRSDIYYYLDLNNINVDFIFDNENDKFFIKIVNNFNEWYEFKATNYEKSVLFYKLLLSLENEFSLKLNELNENIMFLKNEKKLNIDKRKNLTFLNLINNINLIEVENKQEISFEMNNTKAVYKIKSILNYFLKTLKKIEHYKKNVFYTLKECIIEEQKHISNKNLLQNYNKNYQEINFDEIILDLKNLKKEKKLIIKKNDFKEIKKVFNKSFDTLKSFIGFNNVNSFIKGEKFYIEGKIFNFELQKKPYLNFLDKNNYNTNSIPFKLKLLDKNNNFLCDICVVFKNCPILDQILSVYLMVQTNEEIKLLNNSNLSNCSHLFFKNKDIKKSKHKFYNNEYKIKHYKNSYQNFFKNKVLNKYIESEIFDFIFKTEPTWDEMLDFVAISEKNFDDCRLNYISSENKNNI